VVLSDHGELLGEHGVFGHGNSLYEDETRVPLLFRYPDRLTAGSRVPTPVSTVGVYATVLDLVGLDVPASAQAESLLPTLSGSPPGSPVLAERYSGEVAVVRADSLEAAVPMLRSELRFRSYRVDELKLVDVSDGSGFLFDLRIDPDENDDRSDDRTPELVRLRSELESWQAALGLAALDSESWGGTPTIDPAARERLRALGYID